jgi:hypothetical protein
MVDYLRPERFMCHDCGHDTARMGELYHVFDWIWIRVVRAKKTGPVHMLCIGCVEQRLGYTLTQDCFSSAPLNTNWDHRYEQSLRLRNRLRSHHRMIIQKDPGYIPNRPRSIRFDRTHDDIASNASDALD